MGGIVIVRPSGSAARSTISNMTIGHGSSISDISGASEQQAFEKKFCTERASCRRCVGYMFSDVFVDKIVASSDIDRPNLVKNIRNGIYL